LKKPTLLKNLSFNTLQLVLNQLFGLGIFYVLSTGLSKTDFGQINLALAILLAVFNILSLGIDQLTIKKVASGANVSAILNLYLFHVLAIGVLFYGLLLAGYFILADYRQFYFLLMLIGAGKLLLFFSTPFKQVVNGLERFKLLAYMSVISNMVRCVALIVFYLLHHLNLQNVLMVFVFGDATEWLFCIVIFQKNFTNRIQSQWNLRDYMSLLCESLPQTGVVLITSALARFDWIFIGFMVSAIKLAEYSFVYKVFEISTLPLLAIAPLLIPRFTKMVKDDNIGAAGMKRLIKAEIIIASFTVLLLNLCYGDVIDALTNGKYGHVNVYIIFILSLCIPLLYLNNFFWTIYFAQGRMKMILTSFVITLIVNIIGDIVLIPIFKNEGAAVAFLLACIAQSFFYIKQNEMPELNRVWIPIPVCLLCAVVSGFWARLFFAPLWVVVPVATITFIALLFVTAQVKLTDRAAVLSLLKT
jgi:O-antigen/teichoic acid export membrane protein